VSRARVFLLAACWVAFAGGCGTDCRAECEKVEDQLRDIFGFESPCTEPDWDEADSCEACDATLMRLYRLEVEGGICELE